AFTYLFRITIHFVLFLLLKVKIEDNGNCATLVLHDEDHTLGNALRYMIMKNPSVKFCGYSMPHPNERKVILQIQTYPKVERSEQMEVESESGDDHSKRGKHKSPRKKSEKKSIEDPK
ncbi:RNA polymerase I/III 16Kd polypeptide-like protein, partial [Dinothrombium tinctorium]